MTFTFFYDLVSKIIVKLKIYAYRLTIYLFRAKICELDKEKLKTLHIK